MVTLVALLGSLLAVVSPPVPAHAEVMGTGGQYVPVTKNARVFDGATAKGTYKSIKVAGVGGLPSSGIGAVTMMITVADPQGQGQLFGRPSASNSSTLLVIYNAGVGGNTSNSSLLAVGDDGSLQIMTETAQNRVIIDITGYYTSTQNGAGAGGLVAMPPARMVDTRNGTGVKKAQLDGGDSVSFQVTGKNDIPAGAAAVAMNIIVINQQGAAGWIRPSPSGVTKSTGVLNYNSTKGLSTAMNAQVAIGSDGKITLDTASGAGLIDVVVDIQGYFLPSNPGGGFTPQAGRLVDTRKNTARIAGGATFTVQVGGARDGVPTVEAGLSAVALTFTAVNNSSSDTYAKLYADGSDEPASSAINSDATSIVTNTVVTAVGANGKIRIKNVGTTPMDYVIDLQGTYNSLPGGPGSTGATGQRKSATTLPFPITDQTSASVDVGTGNLSVTTNALTLPGVMSATAIGVAYNSRSTEVGNSNTLDANRWQYSLAAAGDLTANASGVVYTDATGTTWQFKPSGTQGAFTTPAGLQQTLTRVDDGATHEYTLKGWTTNQVIHFNLAGQPTSINDRNGNQVSFNRTDFALTTLVSTAGATAVRTVKSAYSNGTQTFTQTNGSSSRSVSWTKNSNGDITSYTDATGKKTTFGYTNGDLTSITAPEGGVTAITYDSSDRVTRLEQRDTTTGSPGTAVTRFSYVSDTVTQVADPRSDLNATVAAAAHTEYTLDAGNLVLKAVDPAGRQRSRSYNPANNGVATATSGTGDTATTTKNTYGKNNGQSLTKTETGSGASSTTDYGSGAATSYLPSKSTTSSSTSTSYGYDTVGNAASSQSGSDSAAAAKLERNADGTVSTATAPGNSGNPTKYTYDANKQLSKITAPTGTTLGAKQYTYDAFGRTATETDGRGNITTYGYDNDDRLTSTKFSDGTADVVNTYDGNGNQTNQTSATGTVSTTYDQLNRPLTTQNTAGGGQVAYGYDLAGNTTRVTDSTGTVTHEYDPSNVLIATTYPTGSSTAKQLYATDTNGRRTDTWLGVPASSNSAATPTAWAAREHVTYDKSGKVTGIQGWGDNTATAPISDVRYCYIAGITAGGDCSATSSPNDRDSLQWSQDKLSGQTTTYSYTAADGTTPTARLTGVTQSGGENAKKWAFAYDIAGNRTRSTETAVSTGTVTSDQQLTFNAAGQITSNGYTYDATGNLTAAPGQTFSYNGAQQLTSSTTGGKKTSYEYAGADMNALLWQSTEGGADYGYTYGVADTNGVPTLANREEIGVGTASVLNDPSSGTPISLRTTDGAVSLYLHDGIGNLVRTLTETGTIGFDVSYGPYGGEAAVKGIDSIQWQQNPFGYKTGIRNGNTGSGLTKFGVRWQTATTGGWIQRDTLDAPLDPSNANRYAFAGTDPINNSDPTGTKIPAKVVIRIIQAVLLGKDLTVYFTTGDLVSFASGFLVTAACEAAVAAPTGGVGAFVSVGFCAVVGEVAGNAISAAVQQYT